MILRARLPDGTAEPVRVVLRRQRRMILHVESETGEFWVSAPIGTSQKTVQGFLDGDGAEWILKQRREFQTRAARDVVPYRGSDCRLQFQVGPAGILFNGAVFMISAPTYAVAENLFWQWWYAQALRLLHSRVEQWLRKIPALSGRAVTIRIRSLKRSWGRCYFEESRIHFAAKLLAVADPLIDYVVLHELAHLLHSDHGPDFKNFVLRWMPDAEDRRKALREQSVSLIWPPQAENSTEPEERGGN